MTVGDKTVHMHNDVYLNLSPGKYFVRVSVKWKFSKYTSGVLSVYAGEKVDIKPFDIPKGNYLYDVGVAYSRKLMKSFLAEVERQEAAPGLSYVDGWMNAQYVYFVENSTETDYWFTVKFDPNRFENCYPDDFAKGQPSLKLELRAGESSVVGTLVKKVMSDAASVGDISFSADPM